MAIWTKQGLNLLTPVSTASSSFAGTQPGAVIYEGNAQLLSGNVFKTWFMDGKSIYYAESIDGISWTRKSGAIIANMSWNTIFKNAGVYYLFCGPFDTAGAPVSLYTCTDGTGVNFSLVSSTILPGSVISTDWDYYKYRFQVVEIVGTTWHAIYTGGCATTGFTLGLGYATSPDGLSWAKYGSNPVYANTASSAQVLKIGGNYYAWFNYSTAAEQIPSDIYRIQSTDLISWTGLTASLPRTTLSEGTQASGGQTSSPCLVEANGITYMFYGGTNNGAGATSDRFIFTLATAPMATLAELVATSEGVLPEPQIALDAGLRGGVPGTENPLSDGGNWNTLSGSGESGGLELVSGSIQPILPSTWGLMVWTGNTFPNDQYAEAIINDVASISYAAIHIMVRTTAGATGQNDYDFTATNGGYGSPLYTLNVVTNGSNVQLGAVVSMTLAYGDVIRLSVVGSTISLYQNGVLVTTRTDTTWTSGAPGLQMYNDQATSMSSVIGFAAGSSNAFPVYGNAGIAGATITYTGISSGSVPADANGNYTLPGLANGSYTVTPSLAGYSFAPTSLSPTVSGQYVAGVSFVATNTPLATPTFAISDGATNIIQQVTITVDVNATATYYTTDGSTPTPSSTLYSGAFSITTGETIQALSTGSPYANSAIGSVTYAQQATPTFNPVAGSYGPTQSVTITSASATNVYYEVGSSPHPGNETLYALAVSVASSETLYARASRTGYVNSAIGSAAYVISAAYGYTISGFVLGTISYKNGNPVPPVSANVVNWNPSPVHFGNLVHLPHTFGNPVQWEPNPDHFGNKIPGGEVTVTLSGDASGTTTTDNMEWYEFTGLGPGTYTITPSKAGYVFAPISQTITINDSENGIDFGSC
jgi:hypothetical protein